MMTRVVIHPRHYLALLEGLALAWELRDAAELEDAIMAASGIPREL